MSKSRKSKAVDPNILQSNAQHQLQVQTQFQPPIVCTVCNVHNGKYIKHYANQQSKLTFIKINKNISKQNCVQDKHEMCSKVKWFQWLNLCQLARISRDLGVIRRTYQNNQYILDNNENVINEYYNVLYSNLNAEVPELDHLLLPY